MQLSLTLRQYILHHKKKYFNMLKTELLSQWVLKKSLFFSFMFGFYVMEK